MAGSTPSGIDWSTHGRHHVDAILLYSMLDNTEIQIIRTEACFLFGLTRLRLNHYQLTNVIKIVTGITDRLGRKQSQDQTDRRTKEALQDRIVFLEAEARRLQEENGTLKTLNDELVSQIDGVQTRERLQMAEIERLIDERDDALQRLDKVENMFKGIFHGEKVSEHPFDRTFDLILMV